MIVLGVVPSARAAAPLAAGLVILVLLTVGCSGEGSPTATPTHTPTAVPTLTPIPTPGAVPTPTPIPTPGAVPTPTPTPTPSAVPTPTPTVTVTPTPIATPTATPTPTLVPTATPTLVPSATSVPEATPHPATKAADPRSVVEAFFTAFNAGDVEAMAGILADDVDIVIASFEITGKDTLIAQLPIIAGIVELSFANATVEGQTFRATSSLRSEAFGEVSGSVEIVIERGKISSVNFTLEQAVAVPPSSGYRLADPSFVPLEGARAIFGDLDGTVYQIEMPDDWNNRLVLWARGFGGFAPFLSVSPPPLRKQFIERGYAWAASSFSSNDFVPYEGALETAALHDLFVEKFGEPEFAYIAGGSMGGNVTLLSLELFPDRYDGALAACSAVSLSTVDYLGHYIALAAFAAGVDQQDLDAAGSLGGLVSEHVLPALELDPEARSLFEGLVAVLTGGPRPFRHEGFELRYYANFGLVVAAGSNIPIVTAFDNTDFVYATTPEGGVTQEELNAKVLRVAGDPEIRNVSPSYSELTGAVPVPLLMIHTTGDGFVPISAMRTFRRLAEAAGNGDLLVQRAVRAPGHCDFSTEEGVAALEDLADWVELGVKPEGEDILGPLESAGLDYTEPLRDGDPGGL